MAFLDYYKMILDRVSFYPVLFTKEYKKARRHLDASDVEDLQRWIHARGFQILLNEHGNQEVKSYSK